MEKKQRVAIVGKSRDVTPEELEKYKVVITVGTNPIEADWYLCLHGESSIHPDRDEGWKHLSDITKYPYLVNSICVLLAYCYHMTNVFTEVGMREDTEIDILASPLISTEERVHERVAVAYWVGRLEALGVKVNWEGGMKKTLPYMWEAYAGKGS